VSISQEPQRSETGRSKRRKAIRATAGVIAGASLLAACSSTGGKPQSTSGGANAGHADTPRATVAMITHEQPGDSFWDLIRKGAQAAADKDNIELRYSNKNVGPDQATLVQSAIDSKVNGIAVTMAFPMPSARLSSRPSRPEYRSRCSTRARIRPWPRVP
jgi:simple sugar transport system substrate-binding protein